MTCHIPVCAQCRSFKPIATFNVFYIQVVVCTSASLEESKRIDEICRAQTPAIPFIRAETRGVFANVFCDFGPSFTVFDTDGEQHSQQWLR